MKALFCAWIGRLRHLVSVISTWYCRLKASSPDCRVQALSIGEQAFSLQYHVEITETTVSDWAAVPAYKEALEKNLGADALQQFHADTEAHMADFNRNARRLYDNFMTATGLK